MQRTPSRASPSGGQWRMATIPATGDPEAGTPQLEFVVVNGAPAGTLGTSGNRKDVDAPTQAGSYRLRCPGGFKLQHGRLHPFPRARAAASMLVRPLPEARRLWPTPGLRAREVPTAAVGQTLSCSATMRAFDCMHDSRASQACPSGSGHLCMVCRFVDVYEASSCAARGQHNGCKFASGRHAIGL